MKDVLEAGFSDHNIILFETSKGTMCAWNLTCRGTGPGNNKLKCHDNTGSVQFGKKENIEEYGRRLEKIALVFQELKEQHQVKGFLVQESPHIHASDKEEKAAAIAFYKDLQFKLDPHFNVNPSMFSCHTRGTRACLFCTFDSSIFKKILLEIPLGTAPESSRYQALTLIDTAGYRFKSGNIHGDWAKPKETAALVLQWIEKGYIIGGDLNIQEGSEEAEQLRVALGAQRIGLQKSRNFLTLDIGVSIRLRV